MSKLPIHTHTFGFTLPGVVCQHSSFTHSRADAKLTIFQEAIHEDDIYIPTQSVTIYTPESIKILRDELIRLYPL